MQKYFKIVGELALASSAETARAKFADLFEGIEFDSKRMLDIGGGSGVCSYYAANMGAAEVVCLEPEAHGSTWVFARMFDRLRDEFPNAAVKLDTRTIQQYSSSKAFDVVLLRASINHIDDEACARLLDDRKAWDGYKDVFSHIGAMMNPGGKLVISDSTRQNFFAMLGRRSPLCPEIEWHKHHTPDVWARLLAEAGFRNPRIAWEPLYRLGEPGRLLLRNRTAAFFLKGIFRLEMTKP
jgi:SAM-dependent methyltransferase